MTWGDERFHLIRRNGDVGWRAAEFLNDVEGGSREMVGLGRREAGRDLHVMQQDIPRPADSFEGTVE